MKDLSFQLDFDAYYKDLIGFWKKMTWVLNPPPFLIRMRFLFHSCGNVFNVMDDLIKIGIDAKHSNEDQIAPFQKWIDLFGNRIGLFGGVDVNILCLNNYDEVYRQVLSEGTKFRSSAKGWGLGSGNSIAEYVPVEGFMGMVDAAKALRKHNK